MPSSFVRRTAGPLLFLLVAGTYASRPAAAQSVADSPRLQPPRSHLNQPFTAPILLMGYLGLGQGQGSEAAGAGPAYGGEIIFKPGSAAGFLDFLYDWNCGLVLQVDYQDLEGNDSVLSGDGLVRRYLRDRGPGSTEVRLFLGLGLGATRFSEPGSNGTLFDTYWSGLAEAGQEWLTESGFCFMLRVQYRLLLLQDHFHDTWHLTAGVGLPFPQL